jgi:porphobilinogen synthase
VRRLVRETHTALGDLIAPLFICEGENQRQDIPALPGICRFSVDTAVEEARLLYSLRVPAVILFGVPDPSKKDPAGKEAWSSEGLVQKALRALRAAVPGMVLIADACFCEYTDHGHCGVLNQSKEVQNDRTLEGLGHIAVSQARAGADFIAPSGMMDGAVRAIRTTLDNQGFEYVGILAYSAKYNSSFYGPFREAAQSAPAFGDRRQYQMDPHNVREAVREAVQDVEEGADIVMVKPALPYLDVIRDVRQAVNVPLAAFCTSGEYAMVKAAVQRGWADERSAALEVITGIKRAGADLIITYWAKDLTRWLEEPPPEVLPPWEPPQKRAAAPAASAPAHRKPPRVS